MTLSLSLALAIINIVLCLWRLYATVTAQRLMAIAWLLMTYFAVLFLPVSLAPEVSWIRGFFDERVTADHAVIETTIGFVLAFNGIFALTDLLWVRLFTRSPAVLVAWNSGIPEGRWWLLFGLLLMFWLGGGAAYIWAERAAGYRDYVEGQANWALVFFWASSPIVALCAVRRFWALALALCAPFLYLAVHLGVRSFALLSLAPVLLVRFFQVIETGNRRTAILRLVPFATIAGIALVAVSVYAGGSRIGGSFLPDSGMPFGTVETIASADKEHVHVDFDGLTLYGWNYINPFMRLFGVQPPAIVDTPVIIAELLDGIPRNWPVYFHFPTLIWADAYVSFGWYGLWLAVLWAAVINVWEAVMRRNALLLCMLLPFFCWHCYMLVRGAVAIASVPVSYAVYLAFIAFFVAAGMTLLSRATAVAARDVAPAPAPAPPPNLLR